MHFNGRVSVSIFIAPLYVFLPVENAVAPAAESVIIDEALWVLIKPISLNSLKESSSPD